MNLQFRLVLAAALVTATASMLTGQDVKLTDTIELKSGSLLTGKIVKSPYDENGREYLVFETSSGGMLKLDVRRFVKRINKTNLEYDELLEAMDPDSPDHHWKIYEWCKNHENGSARFKREMEFHLYRILELDPSDKQAMLRLDVARYDGKLMKKSHKKSGHGYVKVTGGWIPKLHLKIMDANAQAKVQTATRRNALKLWKRQIGKANYTRLQKELIAIIDPAMIGNIHELATKENDLELRAVYLNAIGSVTSSTAQNSLVYFAIFDANQSIRDLATMLVLQPQFDHSSAAAKTAQSLRDNDNARVRRAAVLLRELGQLHVVNQLANALVTTHEFATGNDPNRTTATQQSGGNGGNTFGFGGGPSSVKRNVENREVLDALRAITKQAIGPSAEAWKAWYTSQHTIERIDLRSSE